MPYNTRRKSLSLPSLGIHIPSSHPRSTHRATATTTSNNTTSAMSPKSALSSSTASAASNHQSHPNKKVKRSHNESTSVSTPSVTFSKPSKASPVGPIKYEDATPPPSPGLQLSIELDDSSDLAEMKKIDVEGINDDIVEAVIMRLQETRNRPHLVKELATVLMTDVRIVQQ